MGQARNDTDVTLAGGGSFVKLFDKSSLVDYTGGMRAFDIISSLMRYIFITTIYAFIFAIIRMIYKDIRGMTANESFAAKQSNPVLRVISSHGSKPVASDNVYPLNKPRIIIGRGKASDIMLEDMLVSVKHVCLWFEDGEWRIRDMGSRNGTHLNGQLISEDYLLDDGDVIRVGEIELEYMV